jgi:predicted Zn finger-like uncharacterized protein
MSLITACPACSTNFFVKTEQLNAHHGDVRCGKCSHVFNALERLGEIEESPIAEIVQPISQPEIPPVSIPLTPPSAKPVETPAIFGEVKSKSNPLSSGKRRAKVVWPYYTFSLILILIGGLQTVYFLRTPIATQWPETKPLLSSACDLMGCIVELPKDISQLLIDDSDLQEDAEHEDVIRLSTLLINNAPFAQAYPLLELTLTDKNDRPVLRRAFTAKEYMAEGTDLNAGIPAGEELQIKLALTSGDIEVSGYRVFIAYP